MKREADSYPEPLWYIRGVGYGDYRQTHAWRIRREQFLCDREMRCERCGLFELDQVEVTYTRYVDVRGNECSARKKDARAQTLTRSEGRPPRFHVHHRSYERLGHEWDEDLELLCAGCHNLEHFPDSNAARWWRQYIAVPDEVAS